MARHQFYSRLNFIPIVLVHTHSDKDHTFYTLLL